MIFDPVIDALIKQRIEERRLSEEIVLKKQDIASFQFEKASQLIQFQQDVKVQLASDTIHIPLSSQASSRVHLKPLSVEELMVFKKQLEERLHAGN
jgi:hypothetical protein